MEFFITQAPAFSLYGDGTVIWRPQEDSGRIGLPGALPGFVQGKMDEQGIQALLAFALGQGRLADAREVYNQDGCADCPSTMFRITADGMSKLVVVDALGMADEGADAIDRRGFALLSETLGNFDEQARNGVAGEVVLYDPPLYRVILSEAQPEMGDPADWPWTDVALADFESADADWQRRAVLTREQVALVTEVPSGGVASILVEDPDGKVWTVGVRPLLPDEIAAAQQ
ncbi:hypothetical protein BH23CHL7_BH23CHL7_13250 [soil metagenome]